MQAEKKVISAAIGMFKVTSIPNMLNAQIKQIGKNVFYIFLL